MKLSLTLDCKQFGKCKYYPKNCKNAELMLKLMGRKSFTTAQIGLMQMGGWEIVVGGLDE